MNFQGTTGKRVAAIIEIYLKVQINIFFMNKNIKRLRCLKPKRQILGQMDNHILKV